MTGQVREMAAFTCKTVQSSGFSEKHYFLFKLGGPVGISFWMLVSDDSRAEFQPGFVLNSTEPPVWLEFVADVQGTVPANLRVMVESQATTPGIEIEIGHGILQQKRTHLGCGLLASVFRPAVIEVEFANHFR